MHYCDTFINLLHAIGSQAVNLFYVWLALLRLNYRGLTYALYELNRRLIHSSKIDWNI